MLGGSGGNPHVWISSLLLPKEGQQPVENGNNGKDQRGDRLLRLIERQRGQQE